MNQAVTLQAGKKRIYSAANKARRLVFLVKNIITIMKHLFKVVDFYNSFQAVFMFAARYQHIFRFFLILLLIFFSVKAS